MSENNAVPQLAFSAPVPEMEPEQAPVESIQQTEATAKPEEPAARLCMPCRGIPSCADNPAILTRYGIEYGVISGDIRIVQRYGSHTVYVRAKEAVKIVKGEVAH